MKYFFYFLFGVFQCSYAQQFIQVNEDFEKVSVKENLVYFLDSLQVENKETIPFKQFQPYTKNFPGVTNSRFWFHLTMKNTDTTKQNLRFSIKTTAFKDLTIYKNTEGELQEFFVFKEKRDKNIEVPIRLNVNELQDYYFKVDFTKSVYFPLEIFEESAYKSFLSSRQLIWGIFYGFSIMVLLINMFFYINTANKFFLYYSFLSLGITLTIAELDGVFFELFGDTSLIKHIDVLLNFLTAVSLCLFTTKAIRLETYCSKLKYYALGILLLNALCFLMYVFSEDIIWYTLGEGFNTVILVMYWSSALFLFKKEVYARFMIVGYTVIFVSNILYVLPAEFGFSAINFTDNYFKVGSFIEMAIFLYAISYRHKEEEVEREKLNKELLKKIKIEEDQKKSSEEIFKEFVEKNKFSKRETEVVSLILLGHTNRKISEELFIEETTVKYHVSKIFQKLEIRKRTEVSFMYSKFKEGV